MYVCMYVLVFWVERISLKSNVCMYIRRGWGALNWNKKVFQNKLHTSADKNTF